MLGKPKTCHGWSAWIAFILAVVSPLSLIIIFNVNYSLLVTLFSVVIILLLWILMLTIVLNMILCEDWTKHYDINELNSTSEI